MTQEKIIYAKDLIKKYNMNVIECYGLFHEIKHTLNPADKIYARLCMNPVKCLFRKVCKIKKGEI
jgi:hypothetical protein